VTRAATGYLPRINLPAMADWFAAMTMLVLPWSTSLASIMIGGFVLTALPNLTAQDWRRELTRLPTALPLLLFALLIVSVAWSDAAWRDIMRSVESCARLAAIPLIAAHARSSPGLCERALIAFAVGCTALLVASWFSYALSLGTVPAAVRLDVPTGVPVRDYLAQSTFFALAAFGIAHLALNMWIGGERHRAALLFGLTCAFVANLAVVYSSRTILVVMPALILLFLLQRWSSDARGRKWKLAAAVALVLAVGIYPAAERLPSVETQLAQTQDAGVPTSAGMRLAYWQVSLAALRDAPVLGHGAGAGKLIFGQSELLARFGSTSLVGNPHNQVLNFGVQIGLVGILGVMAMWTVHASAFFGRGILCWLGLGLVAQNVASCLFNSHLFDFAPGWTYVFGVGLLLGSFERRPAMIGEHTNESDRTG
jgi:O-antigen ligase